MKLFVRLRSQWFGCAFWGIIYTLLTSPIYLLSSDTLSSEPYSIVTKSGHTLPHDFWKKLKHDFEIDCFIETGTYDGATCEITSQIFNEVYTIEIHKPHYNLAMNRLKSRSNIHFFLGDSIEYFRNFETHFPLSAIVWIDAHYSGQGTGGTPGQNVALEEFKALKGLDTRHLIFLIDDLRSFYDLDERQNQSLLETVSVIKELEGDFEFFSLGDVGIAFSRETYPHISVSPFVTNTTISRLFDGKESNILEILEAEKNIQTVFLPLEIKKIYDLENSCLKSPLFSDSITYLFWDGLMALGQRDYKRAESKFTYLTKNPFCHWRVWAYLAESCFSQGKRKQAMNIFNQKVKPYWRSEFAPFFPSFN